MRQKNFKGKFSVDFSECKAEAIRFCESYNQEVALLSTSLNDCYKEPEDLFDQISDPQMNFNAFQDEKSYLFGMVPDNEVEIEMDYSIAQEHQVIDADEVSINANATSVTYEGIVQDIFKQPEIPEASIQHIPITAKLDNMTMYASSTQSGLSESMYWIILSSLIFVWFGFAFRFYNF